MSSTRAVAILILALSGLAINEADESGAQDATTQSAPGLGHLIWPQTSAPILGAEAAPTTTVAPKIQQQQQREPEQQEQNLIDINDTTASPEPEVDRKTTTTPVPQSIDIEVIETTTTTTRQPKLQTTLRPQLADLPEPANQSQNHNETQIAPTHEFKYAVMVDCGSSSSKARVYQWPRNATSGQVPRLIKPVSEGHNSNNANDGTQAPASIRIFPGLAAVRDNPDAASDYMRPIMEFASKHVPLGAQPETPVYFMGTAGMRQLSDGDQKLILDDIARDVRLEYNFTQIQVEVINGQQEGAYRWLSCNAAAKRLGDDYNQAREFSFYFQATRSRRLGIIDMGGASIQVTFEVTPILDQLISVQLAPFQEALRVYRSSRHEFKWPHNTSSSSSPPATSRAGNYSLVSVTFLNFGSDSVRKLAVDLLVRDALRLPNRFAPFGSFSPFVYTANSKLVVEDPCLPVGAEESMLKPIEMIYSQARTLGFNPKPGEDTFTVRLIGRGNYFLCNMLLNRMASIAKQERVNCPGRSPLEPCESALITTNFVPWRYLQFLGLGDLYFTTHEMSPQPDRFNGFLMQQEAIRYCSTPLEQLRSQYPRADRVDSRRSLMQCFKSTWIVVWLQNVLLMPMNPLSDLETVSKMNNQDLDWTLGGLIDKVA